MLKKINIHYIAGWYLETEYHPVIFMPGYKKSYENIQSWGRKGSENYAIYCTGSCAGSKADGLADLFEEL